MESNIVLNLNHVWKLYDTDKLSIEEIANIHHTYPNKIKRFLKKHGKKLRDKSEAQKLALSTGRHAHPTKGKPRSVETKNKISERVYDYWQNISDEKYEIRLQKARDVWDKMDESSKNSLREKASIAIREAAKDGSKLEKFLQQLLKNSGYNVIFHKTEMLLSEKLEIDLLLPELKIALEVDGPAHFYPIWGEESLRKHLNADARKNGLLLQAGYVVIRIKHLVKSLSEKHKRDVGAKVLEVIAQVHNKFPDKNDRFIEIDIGEK